MLTWTPITDRETYEQVKNQFVLEVLSATQVTDITLVQVTDDGRFHAPDATWLIHKIAIGQQPDNERKFVLFQNFLGNKTTEVRFSVISTPLKNLAPHLHMHPRREDYPRIQATAQAMVTEENGEIRHEVFAHHNETPLGHLFFLNSSVTSVAEMRYHTPEFIEARADVLSQFSEARFRFTEPF